MSIETPQEQDILKAELISLLQYMRRVREEIAAIHRPAEEEHHLLGMGDQLDAIIAATEEATHVIMESVEQATGMLSSIRDDLSDEHKATLDKAIGITNNIFEACAFQDITGQRVSRVMKSIVYVETRINALTEVWGKEELGKVEVLPQTIKTEDEKLMTGPQLKGQGISQAEIDALFD